MKRSELYEVALVTMRVINVCMVWLIIASWFMLEAFPQ